MPARTIKLNLMCLSSSYADCPADPFGRTVSVVLGDTCNGRPVPRLTISLDHTNGIFSPDFEPPHLGKRYTVTLEPSES